MSNLSSIEKQDLRHAVLYAFARRPETNMTPIQVKQSLIRLLPFSIDTADVTAAIQFHIDKAHLKELLDVWGSETTYRITSDGSLAHERDNSKIA